MGPEQRSYGTFRSALIGYGTLVFGLLLARSHGEYALPALGGFASARSLVIAGLLLQGLLMLGHLLIKRRISDPEISARSAALLELIGDGVTVLLFALATLGPILAFGDAV